MKFNKNVEYWKADEQISKPADRKTIEEFQKNLTEKKGFRPLKRYVLSAAGILFVVILLYNALFSSHFTSRKPKVSLVPGFSADMLYGKDDTEKEKEKKKESETAKEWETSAMEETDTAEQVQETAEEEMKGPFEYEIQDDGKALIKKYIGKETDVVIPDELGGATEILIGPGAFYNSAITSLTLSNSVVGMVYYFADSGSFENCISLEKVYISGRVNVIEEKAFKNCVNLKEVVMEEGITSLEMRCFEGCTLLKELTIPRSVTKIDKNALNGTGITELTVNPDCRISDSIETVNYYE